MDISTTLSSEMLARNPLPNEKEISHGRGVVAILLVII